MTPDHDRARPTEFSDPSRRQLQERALKRLLTDVYDHGMDPGAYHADAEGYAVYPSSNIPPGVTALKCNFEVDDEVPREQLAYSEPSSDPESENPEPDDAFNYIIYIRDARDRCFALCYRTEGVRVFELNPTTGTSAAPAASRARARARARANAFGRGGTPMTDSDADRPQPEKQILPGELAGRSWRCAPELALRDMLWLAAQPSLIDPAFEPWPQGQPKRFANADPAEVRALQSCCWRDSELSQQLAARLAERDRPSLGRRAETLAGFAYEQCAQLAAAHWVMHRSLDRGQSEWDFDRCYKGGPGTRALGEFDFIVRDLEGPERLIHRELAVKLYLYDPRLDTADRDWRSRFASYIGPGRRDDLARKLAHLVDHQLEWPWSTTVCNGLSRHGWTLHRSEARIVGHLFHPIHDGQLRVPSWWYDEALAGHPQAHRFWCRSHQLDVAQKIIAGRNSSDARWLALARPLWMAPLESWPEGVVELDAEELAQRVETSCAPILVALMPGHAGAELGRGFIVPKCWG